MNVWMDCGLWCQGHGEEKQQPPKKTIFEEKRKAMNILQGERSGGLGGWLRDIYGAYQTQISYRVLRKDWQLFIRWTIGEFLIQ